MLSKCNPNSCCHPWEESRSYAHTLTPAILSTSLLLDPNHGQCHGSLLSWRGGVPHPEFQTFIRCRLRRFWVVSKARGVCEVGLGKSLWSWDSEPRGALLIKEFASREVVVERETVAPLDSGGSFVRVPSRPLLLGLQLNKLFCVARAYRESGQPMVEREVGPQINSFKMKIRTKLLRKGQNF